MESLQFVKKFPLITFQKGESVLEQGEVSQTLLAIRTGYVKVTSIDDNGNERLLWLAGRYDITPTEHLFSRRSPLDFFYTALSNGTAYKIDKTEFLDYAANNHEVMSDIARSMSNHYDDLLSRIDSIEQTSVRGKLLSTLIYLARRFSASDSVDLHALGLILTHQDIADMIGSTRETTSLELEKLRADGVIDYDRSKFIVRLPTV